MNKSISSKISYLTEAKSDKEVEVKMIQHINSYKMIAEEYIKCQNNKKSKYGIKKMIMILNEISKNIEEIIKIYNKSDIFKAYELMKDIIEEYYEFLSINSLDNLFMKYKYKRLFRGRIGNYNDNFKKTDLFHIPFSKRKLVTTERFSIPGQPCLYLGQTIFTVWQELKRPRIEELYVSRFCANGKLKILDLALTYNDLCKLNLLSDAKIIEKYIITNLFRIACSVKVITEEKRAFKSEYIIPQLLLLVIINLKKKNKIDGIRHLSVYGNDKNAYINTNYAFPTKGDNNDGKDYSEKLKKQITLSMPVNLGILKMNMRQNNNIMSYDDLELMNIKINEALSTSYIDTEFYQMEEKIMQCQDLSCEILKEEE